MSDLFKNMFHVTLLYLRRLAVRSSIYLSRFVIFVVAGGDYFLSLVLLCLFFLPLRFIFVSEAPEVLAIHNFALI